MTGDFRVVEQPGEAALLPAGTLSGDLCHYASAFLRAAPEPGTPLVLFAVESAGQTVAAAVAWERRGRLFSKLTLPTQPVAANAAGADALWTGIRAYCRSRRIATASMHSFEGQALLEPPLGRVVSRTPREEFILDLTAPLDRLLAACSENHRRNIKKAAKHELRADFVASDAAAEAHAALFRHSMERRAARGEAVGLEADAHQVQRLLRAGAGALAQVRRGEDVLASLLILATASRGYYHSGGSAPEGMKLGASHFAMWRVIELLRERGVGALCLGGASHRDSEGLTNFKLGFNPRRIALAHVLYAMDLPFPWNAARLLLRR